MLSALSAHLQLATADFALFSAFCSSMRINDGLTRCAHDFVWFNVRALRDAAMSHLYRLYDTDRRAISLSKYVKAVAHDSKQTRDDLKSVSKENQAVKKLIRLRHEAISHTSEHVLDRGLDNYLNDYPISLEEMQGLLNLARTLLERFSGEPLALATPAFSQQAQADVFALAEYLKDARPTQYGIERVVLEIDGEPRSKGVKGLTSASN